MTDLRKAAEMALELLENHVEDARCEVSICKTVAALRQALAMENFSEVNQEIEEALKQPEQEPVGYVTNSGRSAWIIKDVDLDDDTPLYAAPPKREWVWLTDEEIKEGADLSRLYKDQFEPVARWAESILKEKNT
jgi:uncharacterized UPF0160 family protein